MKRYFEPVNLTELYEAKKRWHSKYVTLFVALGKQGYLLDHYLEMLMKTFDQTLSRYNSDYGMRESGKLLAVCSKVVCREEDTTTKEHYFYKEIKEYITEHPLSFLEARTKTYIYFVTLVEHWLPIGLEKYYYAERSRFRDLDTVYFKNLHQRLSKKFRKETAMDDFRNLTYECFKYLDSTNWFLEGMYGIVIDCMLHKDIETGKFVFSLYRWDGVLRKRAGFLVRSPAL